MIFFIWVTIMAMSSFLNVNGYDLPSPRYGFQYIVQTTVDAGRNLNGSMVGQKVGRDLIKLDQLQWVGLDVEERERILQLFDDFFVDVTFEDCRTGQPTTIKMYPSDRTVKPLFVDKDTHQVSKDEVLAVNLIDCGW